MPPLLLGLPGDNTYANYGEANRAFWRQTVIPLATRTAKALSNWLLAEDAVHLELRPDLDNLDALAPDRETLWARLDGASFLTQDEKRAAAGYGPMGAVAAKFNPHHDEIGRFTFAPDGATTPDGTPVTPAAGRPRGIGPPKAPAPTAPASPPSTPATPPSRPVPVPPGMTLRNEALAGQKHPVTGIPYDARGFPDFSGVAQKSVTVPHTGSHTLDAAAANRAAGLDTTPAGMAWHHHQDGYIMQLVPRDVHRATGHTGSIGIGNLPGRK